MVGPQWRERRRCGPTWCRRSTASSLTSPYPSLTSTEPARLQAARCRHPHAPITRSPVKGAPTLRRLEDSRHLRLGGPLLLLSHPQQALREVSFYHASFSSSRCIDGGVPGQSRARDRTVAPP